MGQSIAIPTRVKDLTGKRFGRLAVVSYLRLDKWGNYRTAVWLCQCDCGNSHEVFAPNLQSGSTKSCGCLRREMLRKGVLHTTHGKSSSAEYPIWASMISRCESPAQVSYKNYGGRGIMVCRRWRKSFAAFLADMGSRPTPKHTLERRDNGRGYFPGNCCWATKSRQARNTRRTRWISYQGRTLCLADWADRIGMKAATLRCRLVVNGWTVEEALTTPVNGRRNQCD